MKNAEFIGTKLHIKIIRKHDSESGIEFVSVFEEILPDDHMLITAPIHKGAIFPVSLEETLYVHFFTEEGRYDFTCVVVDRPVVGNIYYLTVRLSSEITRSQRREYFRIRKAMKGKMAIQGKLTVDAKNHPEMKHIPGITGTIESSCITHDISGGGLCLYITHSFGISDIVTVSLPIGPQEEIVDFKSEIVWIVDCDKPGYNYLAGLKFVYENDRDRERMVKYVFMLQYEMIRKRI